MTSRSRFGSVDRLPSGRYRARYVDLAEQRHSRLFAKKREAWAWLRLKEGDLLRGEHRDPRLASVLFSEWTQEWMAGRAHRAPTTLARDRCVLDTWLLPALGARRLVAITGLDVRHLVEQMSAKLAPKTVSTDVGVLKAILTAAVDADLIVRSPCRGINLPTARPRKRPTLSPGQLDALAAAMAEAYRPIVYVAGVVGLRWSEIVGLRVRGLDFLRRTVTVSETTHEVEGRLIDSDDTKSEASRRTLAVPAFVMEMLATHLAARNLTAADADARVFVAPRGGPLRGSNFRVRVLKPAVEKLEMKGINGHGLRHIAASLMIDAGEHPRVVQHRLGHSTSRLSMELYAHVSEPTDREAADHLDAMFGEGFGHVEVTTGA